MNDCLPRRRLMSKDKMKIGAALLVLTAFLFAGAAEPPLPNPLVFSQGGAVASPADWPKRRAELLESFRENIYGRAPIGRPESLKFEVFDSAANAMGGQATRQQVKISYRGPGGEGSIKLALFT